MLGTGPAIVTNGPPGAGKAGFQRSDRPTVPGRSRTAQPPPQSAIPSRGRRPRSSRSCGSSSKSAMPRTETSSRNTTSGSSTRASTRRPWPTSSGRKTTSTPTSGPRPTFKTGTPTRSGFRGPITTGWVIRSSTNLFSYFTHSGLDYATIHTDVMVNNPNLFAFLPFDPISNTTGTFSSGRFYTNHELDMPLNIGNVFRFVPYVQGQAVGWTDQLGGGPLGHLPTGAMGRIWGGSRNSHRVHGLQAVPWRRERPLERAWAEQQDQPLRRQPARPSRT